MPSSQSHDLPSEIPTSEQGFLSMMQLYGGPFIFLIPVHAAAVGLAIQGATTTLLETHATNVYAFILSTTIYAFAVTAKYEHVGLVAFISGLLSLVSMVSMVVPGWFWRLLLISWGLVSIFVTYLHFKEIFNTLIMKIGGKIEDIGGWLKKMYHKISRLWSNKEPGLPVLDPRLHQRGQVISPQ